MLFLYMALDLKKKNMRTHRFIVEQPFIILYPEEIIFLERR